jgi:transposase
VRAFLQNLVLPRYSTQGKILVGNNFSAHKKASILWQPEPTSVEFAWTPTNASWLNLIEPWFLVLQKTALQNTDLKTPSEIAKHLPSEFCVRGNRRMPCSGRA